MNSNVDSPVREGGAIAYMAQNRVAANLLMFAILVVGLVSLTGLEREAWPTLPYNQIEVSMVYDGATPEEIEQSIIWKVEQQVRSLDGVKAVRSTAAPGVASVRIEVRTGADMREVLDEVESAVSRVESFPAAAERPQIREMTSRQSIIRLIVHGEIPERALKELAYQIEDQLAALGAVSLVETSGVRDYEISIEVPQRRLRAFQLTFEDIADAVRRGSLDMSAGSIDTRDSQVRIRTLGQRYVGHEFEDIVVVSRRDGTSLRLGDIAEVRDEFQDIDLIVRHQGRPAAFVEVYRVEGEQVMDVANAVHSHLAEVIIPSLPEGVGVTIWNDESQTYSERVNLLLKNGILGLVLVLVALALFMEIRLAIWVTVGLSVTFVGVLAVMLVLDVAINTISLFVFVLAIGIIVDDAIVVAEQVHLERRQGALAVAAAIRGTRKIKLPLIFAVLTSIVAFMPLLFVPGGIGEIWRPLPIIVIGMLCISLIESFFILPSHLSHLQGPEWRPNNAVERFLDGAQRFVARKLETFVDGPLSRALEFAVREPLVTVAGALGTLILSISLIPAGIVPTTFADIVEGDFVTASLEMPDGTTATRTFEVASAIEAAGLRVIERLSQGRPDDAPSLLSGVTVTVGERPRIEGGGVVAAPTLNPQANIATIDFKLLGAEQRNVSTQAVAQAWKQEVGVLPHVQSVTFSGEVLNLGNPVEAVLSHPNTDRLAELSESVVHGLRTIDGVFDVRSDHTPGIKEIQLELLTEARTLGLTLEELARQAHSAFFGAQAVRVQRGREEVRAYVRLAASERGAITDVEGLMIRTPGGSAVPLGQVASLRMGTAAPAIQRRDGQRVVTVAADVDPAVISSTEANGLLASTILAKLAAADPELTYTFGGEQQAQIESLGSLLRGFVIALLLIYALLAIPLRSYTKPFIVMAAIPFALIGVVLGHLVLQVPFSATSIMGILGLSGVVVNDSLVMLHLIEQKLAQGIAPATAIVEGAKGRFRPIVLTSVTTFLGFTPLILERAIQAQFLMPFAASIGFGILVTTAVLMMVVPAISMLHQRVLGRTRY